MAQINPILVSHQVSSDEIVHQMILVFSMKEKYLKRQKAFFWDKIWVNLNGPKRFQNGSITQSQGLQEIGSSYSCDFMYEVKLSLLKKIHGTRFRGQSCLIQYGLKKTQNGTSLSQNWISKKSAYHIFQFLWWNQRNINEKK